MPQRTIPDIRTVKVDVSSHGFLLIVQPLDDEGLDLFQEILDNNPEMRTWHFKSNNMTEPDGDELLSIDFACGGAEYEHLEGTCGRIEYDGAIYIGLDVTKSNNGRTGPWTLREYGYICGGVAVDPSSTAERMILKAKQTCTSCYIPLRTFREKDRGTCDSCGTSQT